MPRKNSKVASRVFLAGVGIGIAVLLYCININEITLPILFTAVGEDVTKYVVAFIAILVGIFAGMFIKYGFRGGRLEV